MTLLDDMLRIKREMDALPRFPIAYRLHPADALTIQRATEREATEAERIFAPQLFISTKVERGKVEPAYDRETIRKWQDEE